MVSREEGIVIEYDGYCGKIKTLTHEYILLKKNIKNNEKLMVGDAVSFLGERIVSIEKNNYIATFVEKI